MTVPARHIPQDDPTPPALRGLRLLLRQLHAPDDPAALKRRRTAAGPDQPIHQHRPKGLVTRPKRPDGTSAQLKSP